MSIARILGLHREPDPAGNFPFRNAFERFMEEYRWRQKLRLERRKS
jgi:hypothetical protein